MADTTSVGTSNAFNRRRFLTAAGATALAAGGGAAVAETVSGSRADAVPARPAAAREAVEGAFDASRPSNAGTTLSSVSTLPGGSGYRRLRPGPGWSLVVRPDLAAPKSGREDRRRDLACFVQFTDLHLVDVQNPLRLEYMRADTASAWRPHEALTVAGAASLVERVNSLGGGPHTGHPIGFVMTTGDNCDNNARVELEWFLTVMSGGRITPNTGDPKAYEGVQNSNNPMYWHPESALRDQDKKRGFPRIPGFLGAAISPVRSPGLRMPWYSTVGNHDDLPLGCFTPAGKVFRDSATGHRKLQDVPAAEASQLWAAIKKDPRQASAMYRDFLTGKSRKTRTVTADPRRAPFTPHDYLKAHLDPRFAGAGPAGHGYTSANLDGDRLYYAFTVADGVIGISLDTTNRGGHFEGSIGTDQMRWLERTLKAHKDAHVLVFSHHTSTSMKNLRTDPARPKEKRHGGQELVTLLHAYPNVVAWINGHTHKNQITAHPHANPARSFWEVNTASHIDYPQLARVIELVDNGDGTLSILTTLIESAAPVRTDFGDLSSVGLASLYRELSYNAPGVRTGLAGAPKDRNTELLVKRA
ncbi:TIGR03767 family metallophosphoesterase [Wenjunlia tyrosinilytica]|uniref:Metallophosphoesterase n=1 Tax=Wenjunlia tyrosinilytica TaxID=1544741 RepID=A0A917ZDG2_9ACTN|nr:TIGR03767 family metallophosphoesterase [Wenjunlia tyrosinilytica]GGO80965.1 metallophosphoesterase [Wenjunlia tyrosinilytica]